jgi:hypothetical protein
LNKIIPIAVLQFGCRKFVPVIIVGRECRVQSTKVFTKELEQLGELNYLVAATKYENVHIIHIPPASATKYVLSEGIPSEFVQISKPSGMAAVNCPAVWKQFTYWTNLWGDHDELSVLNQLESHGDFPVELV